MQAPGRTAQGRLSGTVGGHLLPVLFEEEKNGLWRGHAPNYVEVMAHGEGLHNVIRDVKITGLHGDGLLGELL